MVDVTVDNCVVRSDARRRVVEALAELSLSADWRDRVDAGRVPREFHADLGQAHC
jgi:hypothetical protein